MLVQEQAEVELDSLTRIKGIFTSELDESLVDPSLVTLYISNPAGVVTKAFYPGLIIKASPGTYYYEMTPTVAGEWLAKWQGTGDAIGTSPDFFFFVKPSQFALS